MGTRLKILIVVTGMFTLLALAVVFSALRMSRNMELDEIRVAFYMYPAYGANGIYPSDLDTLVASNATSSFESIKRWRSYYYVANLNNRDPMDMPIVMSPVDRRMGGALLLGGRHILYEDLSPEEIRVLVREPWTRVRNQFANEAEFMAFTNRIRVIPPQGSDRVVE